MTTRQRVVMVATSYPRFPGDTVGTFMEPIAQGLAARGHQIHMVLPWHPRWQRGARDGDVRFHLFKYAPLPSLNVFGYASALEADQRLRGAAVVTAPLAMAAGWRLAGRLARQIDATMLHGHWVVPGGVIAAAAAGGRPLVLSLHGSDVFVAERYRPAGRAARWAFGRAGFVTACSEDLRRRAVPPWRARRSFRHGAVRCGRDAFPPGCCLRGVGYGSAGVSVTMRRSCWAWVASCARRGLST